MSKKCFLIVVFISVALLAINGTLQAQTTTGTIRGVVTDQDGNFLTRAVITVEGNALMGSVTKKTDKNGVFWIPNLTPDSNYRVSAGLDGYTTVVRKNVVLTIDSSTKINFVLVPDSSGSVQEISSYTSTIDSDSSTSKFNISDELIEDIPLEREYANMFSLLPGTTGTDNVSVRGGGITDNVYFVDGVDTTDPLSGTLGLNFNIDVIKEFQLSSAGYSAEYGRATGGIFNAVTKSGTNEFHGELFGYFMSDSWRATSKDDNNTVDNLEDNDYGFMVSNPFIKDKLWFFAAVNQANSKYDVTNNAGNIAPYDSDSLFHLFKLSFKASQNHTFYYQYMANPAEKEYIDALTLYNSLNTYSQREQDSNFHLLQWNWTVSDFMYFKTELSRSHLNLELTPQNNDFSSPAHYDFLTGTKTGGSGYFEFSDRYVTEGKTSLGFLKNKHEIKIGAGYIKREHDDRKGYTGKMVYEDFDYGIFSDPFVNRTIYSDSYISSKCDIYTFFIQDKFSPSDNFTINYGIRWENMKFENEMNGIDVRFEHMIAPRFGFAYDIRGNSRSRLYGHGGRFYDANALTLADMFSTTQQAEHEVYGPLYTLFGYPADLDGDGIIEDWEHWSFEGTDTIISDGTYMKKGIEPMYKDEFVIGYEQEIVNNMFFGINYTYSELNNVIEDVFDPAKDIYQVGNPDNARRIYRGLEIYFNKQMTDHWQLYGSYTWSETFGNYPGGSQPGELYVFEGGTIAFNYPELTVNSNGKLPQNISHFFKFQGSYRFSGGLTVGANAYARSGYSYTKMDYFSDLPRSTYGYYIFNEPRGSYTLPWIYQLDLSVHYDVELSKLGLPVKSGKIRFFADIFNVTNVQEITAVDYRWLSDPADPSTFNPNWNSAVSHQLPRTFRVAVKWIW